MAATKSKKVRKVFIEGTADNRCVLGVLIPNKRTEVNLAELFKKTALPAEELEKILEKDSRVKMEIPFLPFCF